MLVYIGTYTTKGAEGIYVYSFDPSCGELTFSSKVTGIENPTFLAIDPQQRYLYAANEVGTFDGKPSGAVSAFSIDPKTGKLTYLNEQLSHGTSPCHLNVDQTGQFVLVANYGSGSVSILPIEDDGRLGEASDFIQHEGSSVNPERQQGPHAHSITIDPTNRYAFAADLGLDKILVYQLDLSQGKLHPHDEPWVSVHAGAGPRHFAFHPNLKYAYVINEIDSTMTAFTYDQSRGTLQEMQTVPALPEGFTGTSYCADVHVSPSGKYVYGSNRGHDSIVILRVDSATGTLRYVGHQATQGKWPRNFAIDPTGSYLLAANQDSDTVVTFHIDEQTGILAPTGHVASVPAPVCLKMISL